MARELEGNIIKKANTLESYTQSQIEELKKCSPQHNDVDPHLHFMTTYGYLIHPKHGKMLFKPFEYQYKLINSYHNYRFSCSMLSRQTGKCTRSCTGITIRNSTTGEIRDIAIGEFLEMIEKGQ